MSYQTERDQFIARVSAEGLPYRCTAALLRAATTLQRLAELACSSEAADRDRVLCPGMQQAERCICDDYPAGSHAAGKHQRVPRIAVQADRIERRITALITGKESVPGWAVDFQGDPRGYVLRVIPPSYAERNAGRDRCNLEGIGVPSGPSRLKW